MTQYTYGMINRPAYEAAPKGFTNGGAHPDFIYGTVTYDAPLAVRDAYRYEMALVDPLPELPLYPVGATVLQFRNAHQHVVEVDKFGEVWIGDEIMPMEKNWRSVRKWMQYELVKESPDGNNAE